ncbi:MAG: glycosyltransferase, partial [Candidatus Omnitrophota bacterium]
FDDVKDAGVIRRELDIPEEAFVAGMVARFDHPKDYETFFAAAESLIAKKSDIYFVAVGEGPERERFERIVSDKGMGKNIVFTGLRRDIPDLINSFDVGVLLSGYEGCSNVIMEYMACGKPVVASKAGGNPELVAYGETGLLVENADSRSTVEAIEYLYKNEKDRCKMGANGRDKIRKGFTAGIMARKTESVFAELIDLKYDKIKADMAFVMSQFPETHETFILREMSALKKAGIKFKIYSLKPCRDKIVHEEARGLMRNTVYASVSGVRLAICGWRLAVSGLRRPVTTAKTLAYVIGLYLKRPKELLKGLYVWLECIYLAPILRREGVKHIHSHWATMPTTAAVILSKLTGLPYSFTAHAWDIFVSQNGLREKIRKAKFVVTCTDYNRRFLVDLVRRDTWDVGRGTLDVKDEKIYRNYHGLEKSWFEIASSASMQTRPPRNDGGAAGTQARAPRNDGGRGLDSSLANMKAGLTQNDTLYAHRTPHKSFICHMGAGAGWS